MDTDDLIAEIHQAFGLDPLEPGEITVKMYREQTGTTREMAQASINRAIAAGLLIDVGYRVHQGNRVRAYRRQDGHS